MDEITVQELSALLQQRPDVALIDVREPYEYTAGHIAEAKNIPMGELGASVDALKGHDRVYFVCRSGGRSALVVRELAKRGVHGVNVDGGMMLWEAAGLPIV